jgi:hypothetical protein
MLQSSAAGTSLIELIMLGSAACRRHHGGVERYLWAQLYPCSTTAGSMMHLEWTWQ